MEIKIRCLYDELIDPTKLKNHDKNRNKHPQDQIEDMAEVIVYQGWRKALTVSKRSGKLTSGHGRKLAAIYMGATQVPVVYQDYDSEEQEYADLQADNALAARSIIDFKAINNDLADLGPNLPLKMLGIKDFALNKSDKDFDLKDPSKNSDKPQSKVVECPECSHEFIPSRKDR